MTNDADNLNERHDEALREFNAAYAEVGRIAELWLEDKVAGRELIAIEQEAEEARRRYRKWEKKIRQLDKKIQETNSARK